MPEENGEVSYEIDLFNDKGVATKAEVNAANGKIIEIPTKAWKIGKEADKKINHGSPAPSQMLEREINRITVHPTIKTDFTPPRCTKKEFFL